MSRSGVQSKQEPAGVDRQTAALALRLSADRTFSTSEKSLQR
ncbi:hypothetical protein E5Q_04996 [Mixia osmundae IAM 14324]|uniref:Uncharacterized protein n=1 Tax=Mixia osmundae (strain CBS 9802 / IAM 14324 / JCM 22182 / KY 12970) TaxID=764103 RepID=G7E651_MIXOS|nr:hypothetical protein E5Q_04996 [Mixia osmundae IAM 14324]